MIQGVRNWKMHWMFTQPVQLMDLRQAQCSGTEHAINWICKRFLSAVTESKLKGESYDH